MYLVLLVLSPVLAADPLGPGDHYRMLEVECRCRSYLIHIPPAYDHTKPIPVVLVFHGVASNAEKMLSLCGLNKKADESGFIAVYPNGTGPRFFQTFNAGGDCRRRAAQKPDDVLFVSRLLDDLATVVNVDPKRVYATGISNGAMMCHRLAAELSDRIAAIAPVAGTMTIEVARPKRPVPVMHFHGTDDRIVPYCGPDRRTPRFLDFKSVEETVAAWARINGCPQEPVVTAEPNRCTDCTTVTRKTYGPGTDGAEVILFVVEGGGHTWPGQASPGRIAGRGTNNISANDLIWEFFQKHPIKGDMERSTSPPGEER